MLAHDIRSAFRVLRYSPGFALAAVLTMALGVGANTAVFSVVNALLLRPLPYPEADRLVRIHSVRGAELGKLLVREWEDLDRDHSLFEGVAGWYPSQYSVLTSGQPEVWRACMTTANLFRVLGVRVIEGASWEEGTHRSRNPSMILNYELWQTRRSGDRSIIGKTETMDYAPYLVTGVAAPGFRFPARSDIFRAAYLGGAQSGETRALYGVGRLRPGITMREAQTRLDAFAARMEQVYPETNREIRFRVTSLRDDYVGEVRPYLLLTSALAGVVLLIACGNVVNLLLTRGLARRKEIAVRAALGAGRGRLVSQLVSESFLLALLGGILGILLAFGSVAALRQLLHLELPDSMQIRIDPAVLLFALSISVATGLVAGLAPALAGLRVDVMDAVRDVSRGVSTGRVQGRLRNTLVGAELALSVVLLLAAGLLLRSFIRMQNADVGFQRSGMLTFRTDPPLGRYSKVEHTARFYQLAIERLTAIPGVKTAAANHSLPMALNQNYAKPTIILEGQSADEQRRNPFVNPQIVSPNYLAAMEIPLVRGRSFDDRDRIGGVPVTILSRPLAERLFGKQDPLGRRVRFSGLLGSLDESQGAWFIVIGVAEGVRSEGLFAKPSFDVYFSNQQQFAGDTFFVLRTRQAPMSLANAAARAIAQVDSQQPIFDVQALDELIDDTVWQRRIASRLSLGFGVLAALLAAVGTFSVVSYSISQRKRELGIRQAVGATPRQIWRMVVKQGMAPALVGIVIGLAAASIVAQATSSLLYEISPFDAVAFGTVIGGVLLIALLACCIPAWRARRLDPLAALHQE